MDKYDSSKVSIAVDVVTFSIAFDRSAQESNPRATARPVMRVLLIDNDIESVSGDKRLPGAYVDEQKTFEETISDKIEPKIGVRLGYTEQLYTFDGTQRDPRRRTISVSYLSLTHDEMFSQYFHPTGQIFWADLGKEGQLVDEQLELAFDHSDIIKTAFDRLKNKLAWTDLIFYLMPEEFTMRQAQDIYEVILGEPMLNIRRFLKDKIESTGTKSRQGAYRHSELFRRKR
jgi:8-oxo-dGTP diphosphatase